ncbi:Aste57867_1372 [Aphanomyces stellatus]|uniref:Aste57867_1372 protein n=1 Tax=Aphanomyces stellatus TaxID=120398 RepID=A0A485K640_9STRA|nr:hypothetical protein As57867_001371 [Aphanomyces stellatus]VFT78590.1 Aste57867_1372 [Aphanomyces stellatus]
MVRKPAKPELFIKIGQLTKDDPLGIEWSSTAPKTSIVCIDDRSITWSAGLVAGMRLKGVKLAEATEFEGLEGAKIPHLCREGTYPRILILKCIYDGTGLV